MNEPRTTRNGLCSCGSGKKYKHCCGIAGAATLPNPISLNRALAYRGETGRRREAFCVEYSGYLKGQHATLADKLKQQASDQGGAVTCGRGCASCCHLCVIASIQECEAIVYFLYRHEEALRYFLNSFKRWGQQVRGIWDDFQEINRLESKRLSSVLSDEEEEAFAGALFAYRRENIPCPFLKEGACVVYEARPLVCAGVVATTPPDWCSHLHPKYIDSNFLTVEPDKDTYVPYFANPGEKPCFACMPVGVYELLFNGWGFLWSLPGCAWLQEILKTDPEVQSVLGAFRK
jgi:Fe-S-cluster containining protein